MFDTLWLVIALLVIVLVLFLLGDWYLKRSGQKKTDKPAAKNEAKAATEVKPNRTESASTAATTTPPTMNIYNSNLADDLDTMLEVSKSQPTHQERSNQITTKSHIADYVAAKHYHTFSFDEDANEEEKPTMTFTKEDYKKIVALSNIDDKK